MVDRLSATNLERYPRLTRLLSWQGSLSSSEAAATIAALSVGDEYACEAVGHYGGASKLLRDALRNRGAAREYWRAVESNRRYANDPTVSLSVRGWEPWRG